MDIGTVCSMEEYVDRMLLKYAFNHFKVVHTAPFDASLSVKRFQEKL
jgi:hypothetical protein